MAMIRKRGNLRRILIGEKRLPRLDGGGKNWAFVDQVARSKRSATHVRVRERCATETRGALSRGEWE